MPDVLIWMGNPSVILNVPSEEVAFSLKPGPQCIGLRLGGCVILPVSLTTCLWVPRSGEAMLMYMLRM